MSKSMKILLGAFGALLVAAVVLTMLGKPPNLPLGPLQGMLVKEDPVPVDAAADGSFADPGLDAGLANCDPTTGQPIDPATGAPDPNASPDACSGAAAGIDPGDGTGDPAAGGDGTAGVDPATGTDPAAGADPGADPGVATDPGAITDPAAGGAGAGTGAGAGAAAGAGAGAGAGATTGGVNRATTDGTNNGNNPEALRAAKDATGVMQKAKITVSTRATLVPGTGGIGRPAAVKRYRSTVTAASLVMQLDDAAMQQWTGAGKKVQAELVRSFITRLGKSYRKAVRSITVLDSSGTVLAIGDANAGGSAGRVKLY
jgi:hypothetical protein